MEVSQIQGIVEGILFAAGEPVSEDKLCAVLDMDKPTLRSMLSYITDIYNERDGGLQIIHLENSYQLCTRGEIAPYIKMVLDVKRKTLLSPASMEVLSIIAYNQPVTRAYIEQVRGVDSSSIVTNLLEKDLIEERGSLDAPGRPMLFGTTPAFLRIFGLESIKDLPDISGLTPHNEEAEGQFSLLQNEG